MLAKIFSLILPWPLRRLFLINFFGFELHSTSRIGLSWIFPKKLVMGEGARIGHLNVAIHLDQIAMLTQSYIGKGNWITGFPTSSKEFFSHQTDRRAELLLEENAGITNRHLIDCTNLVTIGKFSTFAGFHSQILTHSIDIAENRQSSAPVKIGQYTFIGNNCILLGGAELPDFSVLAAKSLLNKAFSEQYYLYGGVPAQAIKAIPADSKYFLRTQGFVW